MEGERAKNGLMYLLVLSVCLLPATVWAGKHGDCNSCHIDAAQKDYALIQKTNVNIINPFTGKPYGKSDALCMNCHRNFETKSIHPVGIIPERMLLPAEAKGFMGQENEISCFSCHDPHPENKNYMYLRWPTERGANMASFCVAKCHANFAKPNIAFNKRISRPHR